MGGHLPGGTKTLAASVTRDSHVARDANRKLDEGHLTARRAIPSCIRDLRPQALTALPAAAGLQAVQQAEHLSLQERQSVGAPESAAPREHSVRPA